MGIGHTHEPVGTVPVSERTVRVLHVVVVVIVAATLLGVVLLWPSDRDDPRDPFGLASDPVAAHVQRVAEQPCSYDATSTCDLITSSITEGERSGEVFTLEQPAGGGSPLGTGDDILVLATDLGDGTVSWSFYDHQRSTPMWVLVVVFAVAIIALGRWRGLGALAGLAVSLLVLAGFMLPSILDGHPAVLVALVASSVIACLALYLAHGFHPATSVALVSTFAALVVTGLLSWWFVRLASFTGFTDEGSQFLTALGVPIDARGILLAGIVIGSLGVLDDVTVTQVAAVWELRTTDPGMERTELVRRALRIGRDHISSTVNTLFLAYAGASLPLLLLFTEAGQGIGDIATREVVAVEIVRSLVGSIGLVSAVPISTWLAALVLRPTSTPVPLPAEP